MKRTSVFFLLPLLFLAPHLQADAQIVQRAKDSIDKAANWLASRQSPSGHWSNPAFPALTAMPVWALSAAGHDKGVLEKGVAFIKKCSQPDGGIYVRVPGRRGGALGTYNTAISMTALYYADRESSARTIQKARDYVSKTQLTGDDGLDTEGGFGYDLNSPGGYADMNNTAWAVSSMRITQSVEESRPEGEKKADIDLGKAQKYIEAMQVKKGEKDIPGEDEGGFLYKRSDPSAANGGKAPPLRSYGSITYSGLEAMIYAQMARDDPRVVSAVDYARRHWTLEENPGMGAQGLYYYYTIMARALSLLDIDELPPPEDGGEPVKWRDELIGKIISLQREDGSWVNANNRFWEGDSVLSTSYAMLALEYALRLFR